MIIHTVKSGDTIFKIARKWGVVPTKIIEDNGLATDRLTVGQELVILIPTRSVSVRGGDTLAGLAKRFGVRRGTLLSNNPALKGEEKLRPGHILSVKFDTPIGGGASALGFYKEGVSENKFKATLPYLTYIVFEGGKIRKDGSIAIPDVSSAQATAKRMGKITLLGFCDEGGGKFLEANPKEILEKMIDKAKEGGFAGIRISAADAKNLYPNEYSRFLLEARKRMIGCDLILFAACEGKSQEENTELCDGAILEIPDENDNFEKTLEYFAEFSESEKTFLKIGTEAKIGDRSAQISDALRLALRIGAEIEKESEISPSSFNYRRYIGGKGEDIKVTFPNPSLIKAKFQKLSELGFMGIAFDIESAPVWLLSMFNAYFSRADFAL